ncbi:hypothetical protein ACIGXM_10795 [Kitasatospora sp. NPDC052896]|uniref:hypothetical protein n=1 Tax=Kitasatospora sp. NPDC052896 TaxID=3364061 RepID=UPI0037CB99DF
MFRTEDADERRVREHLREAAEAAQALEDALDLHWIPPLVSLAARRISSTSAGAHVELGGCSARTALAIADCLTAHARCLSRIIPGTTLPTGLAQLPVVRRELNP